MSRNKEKIRRSIKLGSYFMANGKCVAKRKAFDVLRMVLVTEENPISL